jgi:hypothetical protein
MTLAAMNLVGLGRAELKEISRALCFAHEIDGLVVMLDDCPIRIVGADRSLNPEPIR